MHTELVQSWHSKDFFTFYSNLNLIMSDSETGMSDLMDDLDFEKTYDTAMDT